MQFWFNENLSWRKFASGPFQTNEKLDRAWKWLCIACYVVAFFSAVLCSYFFQLPKYISSMGISRVFELLWIVHHLTLIFLWIFDINVCFRYMFSSCTQNMFLSVSYLEKTLNRIAFLSFLNRWYCYINTVTLTVCFRFILSWLKAFFFISFYMLIGCPTVNSYTLAK